jgi:hypothetical protein
MQLQDISINIPTPLSLQDIPVDQRLPYRSHFPLAILGGIFMNFVKNPLSQVVSDHGVQ